VAAAGWHHRPSPYLKVAPALVLAAQIASGRVRRGPSTRAKSCWTRSWFECGAASMVPGASQFPCQSFHQYVNAATRPFEGLGSLLWCCGTFVVVPCWPSRNSQRLCGGLLSTTNRRFIFKCWK